MHMAFQGFIIETDLDENELNELAEAATTPRGGGGFLPLLKGSYQAVVTENKGVRTLEFGDDKGKPALGLRVDILPDSPYGAKRVFFVDIPLFPQKAPTDKHPAGQEAWMFWNFFIGVMGLSREELVERIKAKKGLPSDVEGKRLTITISDPFVPNEKNPLGRNFVNNVSAPKDDFSGTPVLRPGQAVAPWLTPDGDLIADHPSLGGGGTRPAAGTRTSSTAGALPKPSWAKAAEPGPDEAPAESPWGKAGAKSY